MGAGAGKPPRGHIEEGSWYPRKYVLEAQSATLPPPFIPHALSSLVTGRRPLEGRKANSPYTHGYTSHNYDGPPYKALSAGNVLGS